MRENSRPFRRFLLAFFCCCIVGWKCYASHFVLYSIVGEAGTPFEHYQMKFVLGEKGSPFDTYVPYFRGVHAPNQKNFMDRQVFHGDEIDPDKVGGTFLETEQGELTGFSSGFLIAVPLREDSSLPLAAILIHSRSQSVYLVPKGEFVAPRRSYGFISSQFYTNLLKFQPDRQRSIQLYSTRANYKLISDPTLLKIIHDDQLNNPQTFVGLEPAIRREVCRKLIEETHEKHAVQEPLSEILRQ